jgi:hypothetical protein
MSPRQRQNPTSLWVRRRKPSFGSNSIQQRCYQS